MVAFLEMAPFNSTRLGYAKVRLWPKNWGGAVLHTGKSNDAQNSSAQCLGICRPRDYPDNEPRKVSHCAHGW